MDAPPQFLAEAPALIFSEVMRDVDLFVGVCSIGKGRGARGMDASSLGETEGKNSERQNRTNTVCPIKRMKVRH